MAASGGTLAAVRCLGQHGIPVTVAGDRLLTPSRWSKYVTRWESAPPVTDAVRFMEWLLNFGQRNPGHVLYPSCEEVAWLMAEMAPDLSKYFRLYQPPSGTILRLLDKRTLWEACRALGIPTPATSFPENETEALRAARSIGYPVLVKPRARAFLSNGSNGAVVDGPSDLRAAYTELLDNRILHPALKLARGIERPLIQVYRPQASATIYSLAGFIGPSDDEVVARASQKILQRPRRLGVGLCFEEKPVLPELLDAIVRLCREAGYYGVFEAEFVLDGTQMQLIDFNPRFYGQMAFEAARGLPLAYLTWLCATGEDARFAQELEASRKWQEGRGYVYCHRFFLNLMIPLRHASGRMSAGEAQRWRAWMNEHLGRALAVDAMASPDDVMPGVVSAVNEVYLALRHPRSFVRQIVLDP